MEDVEFLVSRHSRERDLSSRTLSSNLSKPITTNVKDQSKSNDSFERDMNLQLINIRDNKLLHFCIRNICLSFSPNKYNLNIGATFLLLQTSYLEERKLYLK